MKAVLQRVQGAAVTADGVPTGKIDKGLFILLGVMDGDTEEDARLLADKIAKMRIFTDENGKMNLSVLDIGGEALVVSNFTLGASYAHGNRPDYYASARPDVAEPLYERFKELLRERVPIVESGVFGADMSISLTLWGPVTIPMDSLQLRKGKSK